MPMISVIVPVYNSAKFLRECLDSILDQTFRDFELICVDDGSTDNSMSILTEYTQHDSRIKIFSRQNDGKGAAEARNLGLVNATGKYIQFLDSDDFFMPDMFAQMVEQAYMTDADLVLCRAECFDHVKNKITVVYPSIKFNYLPALDYFSYRDCPDHIFQIAGNVIWNKLFRRELIKKNSLKFEAIPISDDQYVTCLALVLAKRISTVDEAFVKYRINIGTSQVDGYHKHPTSGYVASYSIVEKMRSFGVYETLKRSYLNMEVSLMREYFDRMAELNTLKFLYSEYKQTVFPMLGADNLPKEYFYDKRLDDWYRMITNESLEEILFATARAYGSKWLTRILRFPVLYDKITPGSRVVLVGKNIIGRYWYAQLLLSDYCEVVAWVNDIREIPIQLEYDAMLRTE